MMKTMMQGDVAHEVKVTHLKGVGFGVRVILNGKVNQQQVAPTRSDIGRVAAGMLRMEDKCGNLSDFADRARFRKGEKEIREKASATTAEAATATAAAVDVTSAAVGSSIDVAQSHGPAEQQRG